MLINLSADPDILDDLVKDDKFIGVMLDYIVVRMALAMLSVSVPLKTSSDNVQSGNRAKKSPTQTC
jgi:hypothetical protein